MTVKVKQPDEEAGYSMTVESSCRAPATPRTVSHPLGQPKRDEDLYRYPAAPQSQGIDGPYAQTMERDPLLERRLIEAIKAAAE